MFSPRTNRHLLLIAGVLGAACALPFRPPETVMDRQDILEIFNPVHCIGLRSDYLGYRSKRRTMSAERLSHLFPQAASFERQYQAELRMGPGDAA